MATIKKGTYRFKDKLTIPSWLTDRKYISISFTTPALCNTDKGGTIIPWDDTDVYNRIILLYTDAGFTVIHNNSENLANIDCYTEEKAWNTFAYAYEQLGYTNYELANGYGQTITVTEDTEVDDDVFDWLTENLRDKIFTRLYLGDVAYSSGGKCFKRLTTFPAGLYDLHDNLVASWDVLVNTYGMNCEKDYTYDSYETDTASPYCVLTNNETLSSGVKLIISNGVINIGSYAFNNCKSLTSMVIGNGVMSIGDCAFRECSLTSIIIPDSVMSIGSYAFANCYSLISVIIGNGVTNIDTRAFADCTSLTSVVIGNSVTSIKAGAFSGCTNLVSIKVDSGNTRYKDIDGNLYTKDSRTLVCYAIGKKDANFTIPDGVTSIQGGAFADCTSLTSVVIGNSVTSIGSSAFSNCNSLTSVVIPDSVTSIDIYAFSNCYSLTSVVIGNGVTNIGSWAFYKCTSLTRVVIGNSVTSIGGSVFRECTSLASIIIPDSVTSIEQYAFLRCYSLTSVVIGNSVTSIGYDAFYYCYKLVEVINRSSLNIVAGYSNYGYVARYAKEVHNGKSKIVNKRYCLFYTYNGVNYLLGYVGINTKLVLPASYNGANYEIYQYGFYSCYSLTSIVIPDSVTSIGKDAFYNCTSLTDVYYKGTETQWAAISIGSNNDPLTNSIIHYNYDPTGLYDVNDNLVASWDTLVNTYGMDCEKDYTVSDYKTDRASPYYVLTNKSALSSGRRLIIGDSVTRIGNYAFDNCDSLTSIEIPDSVTSIGKDAFAYCDSLTNIEIPDSVTSIGNNTFYCCYILSSVVIPDNVTNIGDCMFYYCKNLTSIVIPDSVTSIGVRVFENCIRLTSIVIGDSVTSIGFGAFRTCSHLTSIVVKEGNTKYHSSGDCLIETESNTLIVGCKNSIIPSDGSVTSIGYGAFYDSSNLTSILIPDTVTSIGDYAFCYCSSLKSVVIPDNVTSIGEYAFGYCSHLTSIIIPYSLASIGTRAFFNSVFLTDVYYKGTEEQWAEITIGSYNTSLTNATIHYNYMG